MYIKPNTEHNSLEGSNIVCPKTIGEINTNIGRYKTRSFLDQNSNSPALSLSELHPLRPLRKSKKTNNSTKAFYVLSHISNNYVSKPGKLRKIDPPKIIKKFRCKQKHEFSNPLIIENANTQRTAVLPKINLSSFLAAPPEPMSNLNSQYTNSSSNVTPGFSLNCKNPSINQLHKIYSTPDKTYQSRQKTDKIPKLCLDSEFFTFPTSSKPSITPSTHFKNPLNSENSSNLPNSFNQSCAFSKTPPKNQPRQSTLLFESAVTDCNIKSFSKPEPETTDKVINHSRRNLRNLIESAVLNREVSGLVSPGKLTSGFAVESDPVNAANKEKQVKLNHSFKLASPFSPNWLKPNSFNNRSLSSSPKRLSNPVICGAEQGKDYRFDGADYQRFMTHKNPREQRITASLPPPQTRLIPVVSFRTSKFMEKVTDIGTSIQNSNTPYTPLLNDTSKVITRRKDHQKQPQCNGFPVQNSAGHTQFVHRPLQIYPPVQNFLKKATVDRNKQNFSPAVSPKSYHEASFVDEKITAAVVSLQGYKGLDMSHLLHRRSGVLYNQDRTFVNKFGCSVTAFGVFDGHGEYGHEVAEFVSKEFKKLLCREFGSESKPRDSPALNSGKLAAWIKSAFLRVDNELFRNHPRINQLYSGSTGSLVLCYNDDVYIGYVGDSKVVAYLFKGRSLIKTLQTTEHNPNVPCEYRRIVQSGGSVSEVFLSYLKKSVSRIVEAGISLSRAFGDLKARKYGLVCEAEIMMFNINNHNNNEVTMMGNFCTPINSNDRDVDKTCNNSGYCRMLLAIGSDGLWDTVSSNDVVRMMGNEKKSKESLSLSTQQIAEAAWKQRLRVEGRSDDTTAILALCA